MDFDLVLDEIGEFGKFQLLNYLLICLPVLSGAANSLSYVFTARSPNYRCFIPGCDDDDTEFNEQWVDGVLPGSLSSSSCTANGELEMCSCTRYQVNFNSSLDCQRDSFIKETEKCDQWKFDKNERTIVHDWNITCKSNQWKLALVGTMHFAGIMVGSGIFGFLADMYGRKKIFIVAIVCMSVTGIGQAISNNYLTFLSFAFLNAVGTSGVYPLAFVIGVEMVGKKKREMAGVVLNYFYSIGEALVGVIAWLDDDWVKLQFWVSVPPLIFISYYWFIPESIRWLIAKNRNTKALKIIKKAAKNNGVILSNETLHQFEDYDDVNDEDRRVLNSKIDENSRPVEYRDLIRSKILLTRCTILFFIWGTNAFVYYGLSLNSINLNGNIYFNFILGCLVEIPGNTIAWIIMNKIGRRFSLTSSLLLCGITCIAGGFIPQKVFWIQIAMFLVGKMAITSSFAIAFVYSAEMLPTLIRSGGVGTFSTFSRFGALLAPFVPLLKVFFDFLPLLLFGVVAFVAGLLAILLPETLGIKLPDTIEEAENVGKK